MTSLRHEVRGSAGASSRGTLITSSATVNLKGSWTDLGGTTSFQWNALTVFLNRNGAAANYVIDIGISDGSSRFVLIENLRFAAQKTAGAHNLQLTIPVRVPSGAQLSARAAASSASAAVDVSVIGHAEGIGGTPGFSRAIALFSPTSSRGVAVDPGGTAHTKGSWAQITASTPADIGAMFGLIGQNADVTRTATASMLLDIGIGDAASEFVLYPDAFLSWGSTHDGPSNCPRIPPFACAVPSGTRIAARAQCSGITAGDRNIDLSLYGLVP